MRIGTVSLTVRDLDPVNRFYRQVTGLTLIETGTGPVQSGVGGAVLRELRHDPAAPVEGFYAGLLGLEVMCRYPGATFLASRGYHHHIGTNIWNSRGARMRSEPTTWLAYGEIVTNAGTFETVRSRLSPEQAVAAGPTRLPLHASCGTSVTLVAH
jgi:catechol-2,3-dioxygenase